jgi:subtilisin family serine protease
MKLKRFVVFFLAALTLPLALPVIGAASDYSFTVVFESETLPEDAAAIVENAGARIISEVPQIGMMRIEGSLSLLEILNSYPEIRAISPSIVFSLPPEPQIAVDPGATEFDTSGADLYDQYQWDIKQVTNDGDSFNLWPGSHQTVVAVVDTGINTEHPDLVGNLLGGRNFVPDSLGVVYPDDYEDQNGHGSHCAGAIAGNGRILGVGPNLGIKAYRVLDAGGSGMIDWIVNGMIAAADDGVDVISMSIGGYVSLAGLTLSDSLGTEIKLKGSVAGFLAWRRAAQYVASKGVVLAVAAGNEATNISNPKTVSNMWSDNLNAIFEALGIDLHVEYRGASRETPGTVAGVVTVSATGPEDIPSIYTNYGPSAIDLSGPGGDILDPINLATDFCFSAYLAPSNYAWSIGTSMATPKVAAVAALMIDQAKAMGKPLKPAQVVTGLQRSAIDAGKRGHDEFYGFGMVNAVSALEE